MTLSGQDNACKRCGAVIPRQRLDQLCPACLLETLLDTTPTSENEKPLSDTQIEPVPLLKMFGDYDLVEQIGIGGMGVVYRARHRRLQRTVALKMVRYPGLDSRSFHDRFQLEARAAAALDHPDIVPVFEHGDIDGQSFIAMRFVEGESLDRRVARGRMPVRNAVELVIRLAHAVHYAHQRGVLHRDLKPGNVLLDREGRPHLTDFGLARFMEGGEMLTRTTVSMGTPAYMSPEVARGDTTAVTTAADVYGLGTILYETLTGSPPFLGHKPYDILRQVIEKEPVKPSALVTDIPSDLDTISLKALAKPPGQRYGSALELAQDLERWLRHEPILARPPTRLERIQKWCVREPFQAAIAALILIGLSLFVAERTASNARLKTERDVSRREQLRAESVSTRLLLEEADRRLEKGAANDALALFAHVLRQSPSNHVSASRIVSLLHHRNFALPESIPLSDRRGPVAAHFFPDNQRLLVALRTGQLRICNPSTGQTAELELSTPHPSTFMDARISPNGLLVAAGTTDGSIFIWDSSKLQLIHTLRLPTGDARSIDFNHNSHKLAAGGSGGMVQIWDIDSGKIERSQSHEGVVGCVRFHPDGKAVASASSEGTVMVLDWRMPFPQMFKRRMKSEQSTLDWHPSGQFLATQEAGYERISLLDPESLDPWVGPMHHEGVLRCIAFNHNGSRVVGASEDHSARIWDTATGRPTTEPLPHPDVVLSAHFSPDDQRLVTVCLDGSVRVWDVREGRTQDLQWNHPKPIQHVEMSPDGRSVATLALDWNLRVYDVASGKLRFPPIPHPDPLHSVYFSEDSTRLMVIDGARVTSRLGVLEGQSIRLYDTQTGQLLMPALEIGSRPTSAQFFKDGKRLLVGARTGQVTIWDISGNAARRINEVAGHDESQGEPALAVRLSHNEQRVAAALGNGSAKVWNITVSSQPALEMHIRHPRALRWAEFSPDSSHLLTCSDDHKAYLWKLGQSDTPALTFDHDQIVHGGDFDSTGTRLTTFSVDKTARIWDVRTGALLTPTLKHQDQVWSAFFSHDNERIVTATWQGSVRVWDSRTGLPLTESLGGNIPQRPYVEQPDRGRLTPDGQRVLCAFEDQSVRLMDVPRFPQPVPNWLVDLAEGVAGRTFEAQPGKPTPTTARLLELKKELLGKPASAIESSWERWGRWFFDDREKRAPSAYQE